MSNIQAIPQRNFDTQYKWWEDSEKFIKLEQAFSIGCTDKEACSYAEITEHQLYYYQNEINTDFAVRKAELKEKPILKAKQTVVKNLDNPEHAKWYLERKNKAEFSLRTELTGKDGERLPTPIYGGTSIQISGHNGDQESLPAPEED